MVVLLLHATQLTTLGTTVPSVDAVACGQPIRDLSLFSNMPTYNIMCFLVSPV